ncbi:MAG: S-layer homology domain-containing protein, partial [Clostridia bacterium]|nr:S-layer homology domain-containing protein [Clostridia bacterium]
ITAGATKTTFQPNAPCTRGQIATFLYRSYN